MGDVAHALAAPVAWVLDRVFGSSLARCAGCARRRERWNRRFPLPVFHEPIAKIEDGIPEQGGEVVVAAGCAGAIDDDGFVGSELHRVPEGGRPAGQAAGFAGNLPFAGGGEARRDVARLGGEAVLDVFVGVAGRLGKPLPIAPEPTELRQDFGLGHRGRAMCLCGIYAANQK